MLAGLALTGATAPQPSPATAGTLAAGVSGRSGVAAAPFTAGGVSSPQPTVAVVLASVAAPHSEEGVTADVDAARSPQAAGAAVEVEAAGWAPQAGVVTKEAGVEPFESPLV